MNELSWAFLVFIGIGIVVDIWLNRRQKHHVRHHMSDVPEFAAIITLEDHHKAANYTLPSSEFSNINLVVGNLLLIGWTLGGGIQLVYEFIASYQMKLSLKVLCCY